MRKRSFRTVVFLAGLLCVFAFLGCACSSSAANSNSASASAAGSSAILVKVPNLLGLEQSDAEALLEDSGLEVGSVEGAYSDVFEEGLVIAQDPKALSSVAQGTSVSLTVSKGEEQGALASVPDVIGMTQKQATQALAEAKLKSSVGEPVASAKYDVGVICRQSIAPGSEVNAGTEVVIYPAAASSDVEVPDVRGLNGTEAANELGKVGLVAKTNSSYNDSVDKGKVVSQSVPAKTKVAKGTEVTLEVSLGKEPPKTVVVPDILGMTLSEAEAALKEAGLPGHYSGELDGTVDSVDPEVGSEVAADTRIYFTLRTVPEMVEVPELAGMDGKSAKSTCDYAGLDFEYDTQNPDRILEGSDPKAGTLVEEGTVVVALYPPKAVVPDVSGMDGDQADSVIEDAGLLLDYDVRHPERVLVGTEPGAGEEAEEGSIISAVYNPQVQVPDVSGKSGTRAEAILQAAGIELDYDVRNPDRVLAGTDPGAGEWVDEGTLISAVYEDE